MKVKIFSNKLHIGYGLLHDSLSGMGATHGEFIPNENYAQVKKEVQNLFNCYFQTLDYSVEWRKLRFNAQLESGYFLFAIGVFDICDIVELIDEPIGIELAGVLRSVFNDLSDDPDDLSVKEKAFLSEPWQKITIEEKIAFEDELEKEIGSTRFYDRFVFAQENTHILAKTDFSALAKNSTNEEIVFQIHGEAEGFIAVVNVTWSGKKETDENFPITKIYMSLDELE